MSDTFRAFIDSRWRLRLRLRRVCCRCKERLHRNPTSNTAEKSSQQVDLHAYAANGRMSGPASAHGERNPREFVRRGINHAKICLELAKQPWKVEVSVWYVVTSES